MRILFILVILSLFTVAGFTANKGKPENSLQALIERLDATRMKLQIPAVGLTLVNREGVLWSGAIGESDRETGRAATADTYFRIGSITKIFTAMATLMLVEDGLLSLEDSLNDIAPELIVNNRWRDKEPIRIKHLLEHTAGLNDLTHEEFNNKESLSLEQALRVSPEARVTQWPPGLHHSYTNVGPGLLSYVIEKKTGKRYEDFVKEHIFDPLHMSSASFFLDDAVKKGLATGYDSNGESVIPYWQMLFRAFGAINLKPGDMAPLLITFLNHGNYEGKRILSPAMVRRMETPETSLAARDGLQYGYGAGVYSYLRKGHVFYGHGGDGDGYLARFGYNRESGMGYFVVINVFRDDDLVEIRHVVEDYIIRNLPAVTKPETRLTKTQLDKLTGTYNSVTWRFDWGGSFTRKKSINIIREGDYLFLQRQSGRKRKLIPVTKNRFRFTNESVATLAFVKSADDSKLYLQGDIGNYIKLDGG